MTLAGHAWHGALTALVSLVLCGCGLSRSGTRDGGSTPCGSAACAAAGTGGFEGSAAGMGGRGSDAGGQQGLGGERPLEIRPGTPVACSASTCRVESDWEVLVPGSLDDFWLAASSSETSLTLRTYDTSAAMAHRSRLVTLARAAGTERVEPSFASLDPLLVAVDSEGSSHLAGTGVVPDQAAGVYHLTDDGIGFTPEAVAGNVATLGLEIGLGGEPSFWIAGSSAPTELVERDAQGGFAETTVPAGVAGELTLALGADGEPWLLAVEPSSLMAKDLAGNPGIALPFTALPTGARPWLCAAAALPEALPDGTPALAVALLLTDGLHVIEIGAPHSLRDVPLPGTAPVSFACGAPSLGETTGREGEVCAPACEERTSGLAPTAAGSKAYSTDFAITRTSDGVLWVAYVLSDYDYASDFSWRCGPPTGACYCTGSSTRYERTSTLHVVRLAPGATEASEVLAVPMEVFDSGSAIWPVKARAFGERVAVGVAVRADGKPGVRVLTLVGTD